MIELVTLVLIGLIVVIFFVVRQQRQIGKLDNDLYALRMAFLAHREKLADPSAAPVAVATAAAAPQAPPVAEASLLETTPPAATIVEPIAAAAEAVPPETIAAEVAQPEPVWQEPPRHEPPQPTRDIETALGTRWAVWVGGVALALGAIFLIRYAIEDEIFGPRVRLWLAALFGVLLAGGGEFLRRTTFKLPVEGLQNAYVPAILTAAGAFTLFGTVYSAHAVYEFIGPTLAFTLLGVIGVATVAAALVHGQALGAIGLIGSYATPALVASTAPNVWALFVYLAIVVAAAAVIARVRNWVPLMAMAVAGPGLWLLFYLLFASPIETVPVLFIEAVVVASIAFVWMADDRSRGIDWPSVVTGVLSALSVLLLSVASEPGDPAFMAGALILLLMVGAATFREAALPLAVGAVGAFVLVQLRSIFAGTFNIWIAGDQLTIDGFPVAPVTSVTILWNVVCAVALLAAGLWCSGRFAARTGGRALVWSLAAILPPLLALIADWVARGNLDVDLLRAALALLLTVALVAGGEWVACREEPARTGRGAVATHYSGAFAALALCLMMAFGPGTTTVLTGMIAAVVAVATRWRTYPVLGWLAVATVILVIARIALDPTIVGAAALSTRPVLNQLLLGYGIPAIAFSFAAWQLKRTTDGRARLVMEAAATLFGLLTAAMLVRHAMNGGVITSEAPTLGEQAIYTLIALGGGAILIALDNRSPSPVFRFGSMAIGILSIAFIAVQHFLVLNPLFTEESTGTIPVFNLLMLGYLMPAAAAAGLALYARGKRPQWYVAALALVAALLLFVYATLSVRRLFHGEFIGLWKGMEQIENYTYSALWLAMGVAILAVGIRLRSQILRLGSAALVVLAVGKVFLIDMSELEGALRALSFIGLGAVLIGIGLFYQRMLVRAARQDAARG